MFNPSNFRTAPATTLSPSSAFNGPMSVDGGGNPRFLLPRKAKKNGMTLWGYVDFEGCFSAVLVNEGASIEVLWFDSYPKEVESANDSTATYRFQRKDGWGWELLKILEVDNIHFPINNPLFKEVDNDLLEGYL